MRVLIIDDDPFVLKLLARQLVLLGVEDVQTCGSAPAALARIANDRKVFDVLFVDLNMPQMDGVELLRHLARQRFRGALVLVSGEEERILLSVAELARAHQLRVLGTLIKPVSPQQLERLFSTLTQATGNTIARAVPRIYSTDELRAAIESGQLINHYQPQVELISAEVAGVETLVRWQHPDDGLVFPEQFIPQAQACGLAGDVARTVLAAALRDERHLQDAGLHIRMAVNMSMDDLVELDFPDKVAAAAAAAGVEFTNLVIEVTEGQLMRDRLALLDIVTRLRLKRIGLSIDDFGTGHSSLAQLRDIPFDELKLDRGFVHGVSDNPLLRAILEANLGMARQLGLRSVAEGVEDRSDWDCLRAIGCDLAQGYFLAEPMPAAALPAWIHAWRGRRQELLGAE